MQIELKRIQQRTGITFIYVTHDQEEALSMSDTVVVMDAGKIQPVSYTHLFLLSWNLLLYTASIFQTSWLPARSSCPTSPTSSV